MCVCVKCMSYIARTCIFTFKLIYLSISNYVQKNPKMIYTLHLACFFYIGIYFSRIHPLMENWQVLHEIKGVPLWTIDVIAHFPFHGDKARIRAVFLTHCRTIDNANTLNDCFLNTWNSFKLIDQEKISMILLTVKFIDKNWFFSLFFASYFIVFSGFVHFLRTCLGHPSLLISVEGCRMYKTSAQGLILFSTRENNVLTIINQGLSI